MGTSSSLPSTRSPRRFRRAAAALLAGLVSAGAVLIAAAPAHADDGFRYWNYFHVKGDAFAFAKTGPADFTPKDGAVEGWRYGTSTEAVGIEPRADLAELGFDTVCAGTEAGDGEKRVAVLVDYGTEADADGSELPEPTAYCAVAPEDANGLQVLESAVAVRTEDGGICALDGYPASGCFSTVKNAQVEADEPTVDFVLPEAASAETDAPADAGAADTAADDQAGSQAEEDSAGTNWPLVAVIGLVVVLAAVAVPLYRRNRES